MVSPTCVVNIPGLAQVATLDGVPVGAILAYAPTNTNYFGATSCGLSSYVPPTPSTLYQPLTKTKCTLPASVSGKAYSVTPVVFVPRTVSSTTTRAYYTCDPIPVPSINKGNFQFACKSLRGKDLGSGAHTISWYGIPQAAGVTMDRYTFYATTPTSTTEYVVNTALASTTLTPTITTHVDMTISTTTTLWTTTTVGVPTGTTTCTVTVTAPPAHAVATPRLHVRRDDGADLLLPNLESPMPDPAVAADLDPGHDLVLADSDDNNGNDNRTDTVIELQLEERAAAATPTIGKPDFTYPPYGVTTIYVRSISTSLWTYSHVYNFYETPPPITTTLGYLAYTLTTVTVTPTPRSTAV